MPKLKQITFSLILVLLILFSWQIAENIINANRLANNETGLEAFIPSPITIGNTFIESGGLILNQSVYTFSKAMAGFIIGVLSAILIAFLFLLLPWLRSISLPLLFGINSFPIVGLAPAIVLALGQGSFTSIVFISVLICYFPTLITLDTAFNNVDKDVLDLMHVMNASRWQVTRYVR
jgi:NitT/TauT family transport system permease protein